jgi:hypothetical protein
MIKHIMEPNNYLLTPWSRVLLEKLTGSAASQEIPRIFGTRMFLTVLTSARLTTTQEKEMKKARQNDSVYINFAVIHT